MEEQKVQPHAAPPQDTQYTLLGQDNPEDEEEDTKSSEDDDDDSSVDNTTTDKGKEVAYEDIDRAAQHISQEYETSRQGSVVQPSPINPAKQTIQVLEKDLEAVMAYEKSQQQDTALKTSETLESLLDESAQRTTQN